MGARGEQGRTYADMLAMMFPATVRKHGNSIICANERRHLGEWGSEA